VSLAKPMQTDKFDRLLEQDHAAVLTVYQAS